MKTNYCNFIFCFLILLGVSSKTFSQDAVYDLRFKIHDIDCSGMKVYFDVELRAEDAASEFNLADMNFRFSFGSGLNNPLIDQELTISGMVQTTTPVTNSLYSTHTLTGSSDTVISYNIALSGGNGYPVNSIDYVSVGRISLDIVDASKCLYLRWHTTSDPLDFPPTFIGESFNDSLFIGNEGSYGHYNHCNFCGDSPIALVDIEESTPGALVSACVLNNDSDPDGPLDQASLNIISGPMATEGTATVNQATGCIDFTPEAGFTGIVSPIVYEVCDFGFSVPATKGDDNVNPVSMPDPMDMPIELETPSCSSGNLNISVSASGGIVVSPKMFLEGPYAGGEMNDNLNTQNYIPLIEPYTVLGFHNGTEQVTSTVLNSFSIIDWVLIELRDPSTPETILETRAALLHSIGDVTDVDGTSPVAFTQSSGNYFVSVRHRNHLSVMALNDLALSSFPMVVDFTTIPLYGINPAYVSSGVQALWAGDASSNDAIDAVDRSFTWNNRNQIGYLSADCNLDGITDAGDRSIVWNNRNKTAQLP